MKNNFKYFKIFKVILHVSLGTFAPVEAKDITKHKIHHEWQRLISEQLPNLID